MNRIHKIMLAVSCFSAASLSAAPQQTTKQALDEFKTALQRYQADPTGQAAAQNLETIVKNFTAPGIKSNIQKQLKDAHVDMAVVHTTATTVPTKVPPSPSPSPVPSPLPSPSPSPSPDDLLKPKLDALKTKLQSDLDSIKGILNRRGITYADAEDFLTKNLYGGASDIDGNSLNPNFIKDITRQVAQSKNPIADFQRELADYHRDINAYTASDKSSYTAKLNTLSNEFTVYLNYYDLINQAASLYPKINKAIQELVVIANDYEKDIYPYTKGLLGQMLSKDFASEQEAVQKINQTRAMIHQRDDIKKNRGLDRYFTLASNRWNDLETAANKKNGPTILPKPLSDPHTNSEPARSEILNHLYQDYISQGTLDKALTDLQSRLDDFKNKAASGSGAGTNKYMGKPSAELSDAVDAVLNDDADAVRPGHEADAKLLLTAIEQALTKAASGSGEAKSLTALKDTLNDAGVK